MPPFLPRKRLRSLSPSPGPSTSNGKRKAVATPPRKPTLFDALDASSASKSSNEQREKLLANLAGNDDDESELSSLSDSEPEFEDVPAKRQRVNAASDDEEDEDIEDIEFEDVPTQAPISAAPAPEPSGDLELTLTKETRISLTNPYNKKQGPSKIERGIRIATHCMHVQTLMWHNAVRNAWICDKEVQQILIKQLGPTVIEAIERWRSDSGLELKQKELAEGKRKPKKSKKSDERSQRDWGEPAKRLENVQVNMSGGDPLIKLMRLLSKYWRQRFRITSPGLKKTGYMSLYVLDEELKSFKDDAHDPERHGECIHSIEDFRARAKSCEGSRDLAAQMFVALLRGIGFDARIVVSLQPVGFGWSKNEEADERKEKNQRARIEEPEDNEDTSNEDSEDEKPFTGKGKGKGKANPKTEASSRTKTRIRSKAGNGNKDAPIDLSDSEVTSEDDDSVVDITPIVTKRGLSKIYEKGLPPNYWTEVLSPITNTYVPVNPMSHEPVASNERIFEMFTPRGGKSDKAKQVMAYVVGFSADGTAKDVTVRYLRRHMWPGKTKGVRIPVEKMPVYNQKGKLSHYEEFDWFKTVMSGYTRRSNARTEIDEHEEAADLQAVKPEKKEVKEGEETLQSYKSSAEFVLERHLRREEALLPGSKHVKIFSVKGKKGEPSTDEKVFLRKNVVSCKSIETWHKVGREPKVGEHPLKRVPYRAATTNRKRELAEAEALNGEKMLQGLYSEAQTDWIIPPPIENGVIPKNAFGNMDVYTPSMVPVGAVHIPRRGTTRICKKLGIDFAEAVTGFEFGARMAIPIITGVVVAEENAAMLLEQWKIEEAERLRKEDEKRTKTALGMWRKFLMGLRIVERVREEYGTNVDDEVDELNPWINKKSLGKKVESIEDEVQGRIMDQNDHDMAGGFFPEGHDEEEPAQSFFPTSQMHEEDEEGGFIVEGHRQSLSKKIGSTATSYATPISMQSKSNGKSIKDSDEDDMEDKPYLVPSRRRILETKSTSKPVPTAKKRGRPSLKASEVPQQPDSMNSAAIKKGRMRKDTSDDVDAEDEESSLSDLESDDPEFESKPPKSRRRATLPAKRATKRTIQRRGAARKSEIALKSHYFAHNDEDDDGEEK